MEVGMNKYQTQITQELLDTMPQEVQDQLYDAINNVEYIQRLISPSRQYAKDRPRDSEGKIIVDLANPHILQDMDYFRPSAIAFKKNNGRYTLLRPNGNPNSEYGKWIREEKRRCWDGYVRESDGEWVPGLLYFYLNYCPIIQSKIVPGTKQALRIIDFPEMWEGIYLRFHYMDQARRGGLYNDFKGGQHGAELASRGKAFAYSQYVETPEGRKKWEDIHIGDSLFSIDGSTTKVINIPFDDKCEVYKVTFNDGRQVLTTKQHLWKLYKNGYLWNKLYTTEEVMNHSRVTRFAIPKIDAVEFSSKDTLINPYLLGLLLGDGSMTISSRNRAQFTSTKEDAIYYQKELNMQFIKVANNECGWLIPCNEIGTKLEQLGLKKCTSIDKFIPKDYLYNSKEVRYSVLKGLLDTDGSVHSTGKPEFYTISQQLADDVAWLCRSLGYIASIRKKHTQYKKNNQNIKCKDCYIVYIQTNDKLFGLERKNQLCGNLQGKNLKQTYSSNIVSIEFSHIEQCKCVTVDRDDGMFLIGDFIPTHNSKSYCMASVLAHNFILGENATACQAINSIATAYQKEYLIKDGVLNKFISMANFCAKNTQFPRKRLKQSLQEMTWIMGYKDTELDIEAGTLNSILGVSSKDDESKLRGKRAVFIGIEEFGTFPRLIDLYNVLLPSVQEGDYVFGLMYLQGTAGDNESDFSGAQEIMYNPLGYNMYALPNIYDKNNQGKRHFVYFFPGYLNRKGCYNEDGVSDITAALIEILMNRYRVKYNSSDPNTIIKTIAEVPITPAEAIVKTGVNMFPVTDLTERIGQLDSNPREYDDVYTGTLVIGGDGEIKFKPTDAKPIRDFPHKDNKIEGAIEIFEMPVINKKINKPYQGRYILGADPYDDDSSETMSLGSIFVLDLWTDRLVAEYTGRPMFADDYYEICRKLCLFYNGRLNYESNKKGLFGYFSARNCVYLLTDILDFLKEKKLRKESYVSNKTKGTNASAPVNAYARSRTRSWLLKPVPQVQVIDGKEQEVTIPNLYTIRNRAFLKELINYNSVGNFDRISAVGMLMLLREQMMINFQNQTAEERENKYKGSYLGNDKFFEVNYRK